MKLYYASHSCSLSPHIIANEAGIDLALEKVDIGSQPHRTASGTVFAGINPKDYVPALQLDDGQLLTEGVALALYLADRAPRTGLAPPEGTPERYRLLEWLTFGTFNKAFRPNRTRHDWLSRDPASVDAYLADPLCGFRCTNQLWIDLFGGLLEITPVANLAQIPHDLPLLVIGGERDPVSDGRRQLDLVDALRRAGLERVSAQLYPDARHELLHETNRADVIAFLLDWLEAALANRQSCHPKEIA